MYVREGMTHQSCYICTLRNAVECTMADLFALPCCSSNCSSRQCTMHSVLHNMLLAYHDGVDAVAQTGNMMTPCCCLQLCVQGLQQQRQHKRICEVNVLG
jgi:hypothetical protein